MKKIKCCPHCGGTIEVSYLYQYSYDFRIGKRGKMLKRFRTRDIGSMEIGLAHCVNTECDTNWEDGEFMVDENGCFFDLKYLDKEV